MLLPEETDAQVLWIESWLTFVRVSRITEGEHVMLARHANWPE